MVINPRAQKTLNMKTVPLKQAKKYTEARFKEFGLDAKKILPNFSTNYTLTQNYLNKFTLDIPRNKMPVIEPDDMKAFEAKLKTGKIDIFKPFAKGKRYFPSKFKSEYERQQWLELGRKDGKIRDDMIPVNIIKFPAGQLKPLQSQIWLNLVVKYIIKFGPAKIGARVNNTTIIVSREFYIIDGHHRWAQVMLTDPRLPMKCLLVPFTINELLKIGRTYGNAIGNIPNQ